MTEAADVTADVGHDGDGAPRSRLPVELLARRGPWIDALVILAVVVLGFIVLGFLASYFETYFRIILIVFMAWFLAFLLLPPVNFIARHVPRLPRPLAVLAVLVPLLVICLIVAIIVLSAIASSLISLLAALPDLALQAPAFIASLEAWLAGFGLDVDLSGAFKTLAADLLVALGDFLLALVEGALSGLPFLIDGIIVISLAVFMAIDSEKIFSFGLDLVPADHREEALLFRRSVGRSFGGFMRSQVILGALYGLWAFIVCLILGIPYAPALGFLSGVIMAIPIYGPYVSWLPPVIVAALTRQDLVLITAALMLVGWFIDENILAPLVRADAVELHPIVVTVAFLLGAELAGAIGALVSIPIAAIISSFFFYYLKRYRERHGLVPDDDVRVAGDGAAPPPMASPEGA